MDKILNGEWTLLNIGIVLFAVVFMLSVVLFFVTYAIYFERKVVGFMQYRIGPNRVGPFGLLQSVADIVKLLIKEDTIPKKADRMLFILAPVIAFVPSFAVIAVIPFTDKLYFTNIDSGVLYYIALSGISTIGVIIAGWASNNKYSLLGGIRSAAQMISYEVPLLLSITGTIMISGSMNLRTIALEQSGGILHWNIVPQFIGFIVFAIAAVSELNRTPFDLPEAESELVAGYYVEYSGFRFAFFMLTEYVYMFAISSLITVLFLGGWHAPLPILEWHIPIALLEWIPGLFWFGCKFAFCVFFLFWIRATLPRVRVDQLMGLGWKVLLPLSLLNILVTAAYMEIFIK
ncbi:MAG: NADH-quinone oxidoreductase subunit NuoH [Gorillibacterium sp.]|nr:NADH-quinone oxidoreductase subunit NuoH [Gorillibacterium sp.]